MTIKYNLLQGPVSLLRRFPVDDSNHIPSTYGEQFQASRLNMPEIRLESFILRSSMATGFQWAGFHWSRHWGLLINGLLYELTLGEKAFIFRSFTFDGEIPDAAREVTSSTYMGWTHCTDEELRVIGMYYRPNHS